MNLMYAAVASEPENLSQNFEESVQIWGHSEDKNQGGKRCTTRYSVLCHKHL